MTTPRAAAAARDERVVVEADGGSRGNPGDAAYGAVLKDASGTVLAEAAERIGRASNNVAEYQGLLAGLRLALEHAPGADVEVRMDSKLVVEQMEGRWKIKHPDMQQLAHEARGLESDLAGRVSYTWVPRAENAHADRLANAALDGDFEGVRVASGADETPQTAQTPAQAGDQTPSRGWSDDTDTVLTTVVLVRHGVTEHTAEKRFSGGLGGLNPGLTDDGREQVRRTARWLSPMLGDVDVLLTSPVRRAQESADIVAAVLGGEVDGEKALEPAVEMGLAETEFGAWDGLTFGEVDDRDPEGMRRWLASPDVPAGGDGESFATVADRVRAGLGRILAVHAGGTVVAVSHVTPIKILVAEAMGLDPLRGDLLRRMELSPASVCVMTFVTDADQPGTVVSGSLRLFNATPPA
ncbi:bifunctional RNase H/acid phosphatase [Nocardioidaceae bacterium]|nr:bifunctional RNase H/acid phosphatase [Nocardioidaceae bacterium]